MGILSYIWKAGDNMELLRPLTIIGLLAVLGFGLYWVKEYRDKALHLNSLIGDLTDCNSEMKRTLLRGLVARFSRADSDDDETTLDFERFVAKLLRMNYGGKTSVTRASADYGVDIEYREGEDLYLGQVKCYQEGHDVDYMPLAIIHSQMVRQGGKGGFIVTTSDFTSAAKKYARDLEIELINGAKLINLWSTALKLEKQKRKAEPEPQQA